MIKFYSIPEWANYIAQNNTGEWMAYEIEPSLDVKYQVWINGGKEMRIYPIINSTLQKIK